MYDNLKADRLKSKGSNMIGEVVPLFITVDPQRDQVWKKNCFAGSAEHFIWTLKQRQGYYKLIILRQPVDKPKLELMFSVLDLGEA